jgi:hypothetical protein
MNSQQFASIYGHLIDDAIAIQRAGGVSKLHGLSNALDTFGCPDTAILLLPLYSVGMAAHVISPRIEHLKQKAASVSKSCLDYFLECSCEDLESICEEKIIVKNDTGKTDLRPFGDFFPRLYEMRRRARKIVAANATESLIFDGEFPSQAEFKVVFKRLTDFPGISEKAAQHILMELGWPIIKPDRHIQRILNRMGGWETHFPDESGNVSKAILKWYEFQKAWGEAVRQVNAGASTFGREIDSKLAQLNQTGRPLPSLGTINSRQIDLCLMWFSQTQTANESGLAAPRCTDVPVCRRCSVPGCKGRRD